MTRRPGALLLCLATFLMLVAWHPTTEPAAAASSSAGPGGSAATSPTSGNHGSPVPIFAFYYQWFDPSSWNRAKIDYPAVGRYSSDDPRIMRQQIRLAKGAGIDGFIVSWKDTATNTRRLHALVEIAAAEHFYLAMIYQGLDFNRRPLPVSKVADDFRMFKSTFANNPVFYRLGGKPLTIWSGTWAFSYADVQKVTSTVRPGMLVLSTEKSVDGYRRIADLTDGDAYYWSSLNPQTNRNYASRLTDLSSAIHADGKYWIAPFAPGFDARLVGGTKSVPRNDGATLRTEYGTALRSSPDMLGLISWNEFSENTYVEPSVRFGRRYLDVLADLTGTQAPTPSAAADSSFSPPGTGQAPRLPNLAVLAGLPALLLGTVTLIGWRRRRRQRLRRAINRSTSPGDAAGHRAADILHEDRRQGTGAGNVR
ncbi:MAG: hypothetical protein QOD87_1187 [Pseudonocardiales bacterium]|nr:hypothetical protein [Pseudonocardiales bacterium]